jgi:actin
MTAIQERLKKMETFFDQKEFVVIDNGTGFIKAGFSGEDLPRCVIPTVVGTHAIAIDPSQVTGPVGGSSGTEGNQHKIDYAFGPAAFAQRATHELHFPIKRGIIEDFEHMALLWEYIFEKELNLDPKNMNILLTDSPLNSKENKQEIAQIMFEKFKVESLAIVNTAVLSLFSTGKTSGIVAECGEGVSYTVPVFEGYALPHAIHKLDIAGQDVTNELIR